MKKLTYALLAAFVLLLGACSEDESSNIVPMDGEDLTIEKPINALRAILSPDRENFVASNGKVTITVPVNNQTQNNIFGPFTVNGTLTRIETNQQIFVPNGFGLAAGYYLCDIWESSGTANIPSGSFAFDYTASTEGFITPNIVASNAMNTAQGTGVVAFGTQVKFVTYSVVPMYNLLGQYIYAGSQSIMPRNLPNNNLITYFYFQP